MKARILLIDDDLQSLESTQKILEYSQFEVTPATSAKAAIPLLTEPYDLILSDVRMPEISGFEFLKLLKQRQIQTPLILMTAFGKIEDAVWAMKAGAVDFLSKPFKRQTLIDAVQMTLRRKVKVLTRNTQESFIGLEKIKKDLLQIAPTSASVLIRGESGTGKEQVAKSIHALSSVREGPFVVINCAALPESLLESELFGYEKGAFTGATQTKLGLFEQAHQGTLFLDEIGDMPLSLQVKLLRVLQESQVRRLGSNQERKVQVRILAATHQDLKAKVSEGQFRQDLLFRLEVIELVLPPLRKRKAEIPLFIDFFVKVFNERHQKSILDLEEKALQAILNYDWPGNVRELQNALERAIVISNQETLRFEDLPMSLQSSRGHLADIQTPEVDHTGVDSIRIPVGTPLKEVESLLIKKTLELTHGDKEQTAKLLGINSRTIYRKLKEEEGIH